VSRTSVAAVVFAALIVFGPRGGQHVLAADDATLAPVVLRTTDHPPVPRDLSQFWMAPDARRPRTAAQANLAAAVKSENEGNHTKALSLLTSPATKQDGPLAAYADFYRGLAQLHLGRVAEARATFQALQAGRPVGYISEAAALREAECDETLGDQVAALAVYERLAAI
jgi:hypothetical protein